MCLPIMIRQHPFELPKRVGHAFRCREPSRQGDPFYGEVGFQEQPPGAVQPATSKLFKDGMTNGQGKASFQRPAREAGVCYHVRHLNRAASMIADEA